MVGSSIPKSKCQNSDKMVTFLVKIKNIPYCLKCKINPNGVPAILEKFPNNTILFFGTLTLYNEDDFLFHKENNYTHTVREDLM